MALRSCKPRCCIMSVGRVLPFIISAAASLLVPGTSEAAGFDGTTARVQVACHSATAHEIVLLTFGQSISASEGEAAYKQCSELQPQ
jgi:hypothetical protein